MKALDAYLGDGTTKVLKVYRGQDLIYMRPPEHYIECIADSPFASETPVFDDSVFIPISGDYELEYGDTFEIDFEAPTTHVGVSHCLGTIIGGSFHKDSWYAGDYYDGIHIAYDHYISSQDRVVLGIQTANRTGNRFNGKTSQAITLGERQLITLTYDGQDESSSPYNVTTRTDGGFYLFAYKAYDTDTPWNKYDEVCHLYQARSGKFYRITIKDSNDNLKYDFVPQKLGNQIGMFDTVSNTFFPANDSTKFAFDGQTVSAPMLRRGLRNTSPTPNIFDDVRKVYFNQTEIPLIHIQDRWWWDKFNYDIRKFEIVEEED